MDSLIELYLKAPKNASKALSDRLPTALIDGNITEAMETLKQFMASIPYDLSSNMENYYQTVIHIIFNMFGLSCRSEVRIATGRIDTIVETDKYFYCFEFKIDKTAEEALSQIDTKEYLLPWQGIDKKLFKVGVNFDSKKRNIGEWVHRA
jgi:hypothetical protein